MDTSRWPHNLHLTISLGFHLRVDISTLQDLAVITSSRAALPQCFAEYRWCRDITRLLNSQIGRCRSGWLRATTTFLPNQTLTRTSDSVALS